MTLVPGTKLGPYEILSPLGAGGMGEVWKAQDKRLDRFVAVKVLPEHLAKHPESLARFEREAKAVAALNHPNILGIHDFATQEDTTYVVMELLEGESLRARLDHGPIPPRTVTDLAIQMAQGLAAAHEKGVVHRDLKPDNLWITKEGRLKILDFGLAKQMVPMGSNSDSLQPTAAVSPGHHTDRGMVLGTVGYMSPEQVRGESVDARSDIFSFGVVLFEMLSGQRPFKGETAVQTMAAILEQDPPELTTSRGPVPQGLEGILGHCLEKRPEVRFQSMKDIAFDLQNLGTAKLPSASRGRVDAVAKVRWQTAAALLVVVLLLGLGLGFGGLLQLGRSTPPPTFKRLTYFRGTLGRASFANQGQTILYSARVDGQASSLYNLSLGSAESTRIGAPGTYLLSVSSGNDLLVLKNARTWGGGTMGTLAQATQTGTGLRELGEGVYQADWIPGTQTFALARITDSDAQTEQVEFPMGRTVHRSTGQLSHLRVSPDGRRVLFLESDYAPGAPSLLLCVGPDGKVETLTKGNGLNSAVWGTSGNGILISEHEGDQTTLSRLTLSGSRTTLWRGAGNFQLQCLDAEGRLLLTMDQVQGQVESDSDDLMFPRNLSWLSATGAFAMSRDGQSLFFNETGSVAGTFRGIYVRKAHDPTPAWLGAGAGTDISPDGRMVLAVTPTGRFRLIPTGVGTARDLDTGPGTGSEGWFFPDGHRLLLDMILPNELPQMMIFDLETRTIRPAAPPGFTCFTGGNPLSPDGNRLALYNRNSKTAEVTIWVFPIGGEQGTQVSAIRSGERVCSWTQDGRGLYVFQREAIPNRIDRVDIATGHREPWKTFHPADPAGIGGITDFVLAPDGRHVVFNYKRVLTQLFLVEGLK